MADIRRLDRRLFVRESGRAIGFAVLGSGLLAACSDSGELTVDPATTTSAEVQSTTTSAEGASSTSGQLDQSSGEPVDAELEWLRVSLGFVSAYVLARGTEVAIVDTGTAGSSGKVDEALSMLGAGWNDVDHIVLTHLHADHVGGLPEILGLAADATAWAGEADVAGIDSPRTLQPLNDGDEVFGLQVIGTPGHTAGHISVLDPTTGFLVAGDALNEADGMVLGPNPRFASDIGEANASVGRLAQRQFETVVFGHGDPIIGGASDAVVALAQTL